MNEREPALFKWQSLTNTLQQKKDELVASEMLVEHFTASEFVSRFNDVCQAIHRDILSIIGSYVSDLPTFLYARGMALVGDNEFYYISWLLPFIYCGEKWLESIEKDPLASSDSDLKTKLYFRPLKKQVFNSDLRCKVLIDEMLSAHLMREWYKSRILGEYNVTIPLDYPKYEQFSIIFVY